MENLTRTEYSARNTAVALISKIIAILMGYAVRVVFTSALSASYVGVSGLFMDIVTVLSLSELGIETAITYALYQPIAYGDIEKQKSVIALFQKLYRVFALGVGVIGLVLIPFLPMIIKDPGDVKNLTLIYLLYLVSAVVSYFFIYRKTLMDASQIRYVGVACHTVFLIIQDVAQIIILITTRNFIIFLCIGIFCKIGFNLTTSFLSIKRYPYLKDKKIQPLAKVERDDIYKNIRAMLMHKLGTVMVNNTDNILLSAMTGIVNAGIYANNYLIFASIRQLVDEIFDSITASVGNLSVTENDERACKIFDCSFFVDQWISAFTAICIFMLLPPFCRLSFGGMYAYSFYPMLVITINFYVTGMRRATIVYRNACGLFYYDRYKAVAEALINIVASILFTLKFGFVGVFIGTFVSTMTTSFWVEPFVLYKYKLHKPLREYFKKYLIYSFVFAVCLFLTYRGCIYLEELLDLGDNNLIALLAFRLFFCIVFANLLYLACFFRMKEFKLVMEKARFLYDKRREKESDERFLLEKEESLLKLIRESITGEFDKSAGNEPTEEIVSIAKGQSVCPLIFDAVRECTGGSGNVYEWVRMETEQITLQSYRLLFETKRICSILESEGIRIAVLKGAAVSSFYPVPEYRKSGDIDILLCDISKKEIVLDLLNKNGYPISDYQNALHHIVLEGKGGIEIEMHINLVEPFDNDKINNYVDLLLPDIAKHIAHREVMGIDLPILDDKYQAYELILHMLHHFLRTGFGLRLLCDWVVYWNDRFVSEDGDSVAEEYKYLVSESGVSGFSDMITGVCYHYLGLCKDAAEALTGYDKDRMISKTTAKEFLREVLDGGEFGRLENDRMVIMRSSNRISYVREFHHQMRLNFPNAGRFFVLWPALWMYTLVKFVYNNINKRHTTMVKILKKSRERSRIMKQMHLWEK